MNCSRCGAEIANSATFCSRCGAARQDSASMAPTSSTSSPYLPTGAPPWPTTMPQHFPTVPPAAPLPSTTNAKIEPPRRSRRGTLLAVALLVLVPLLGAAATYGSLLASGQLSTGASPRRSVSSFSQQNPQPTGSTATQTPSTTNASTLAPPTSFLAMSAANQKNLTVTVKYPGGWVEEPARQPGSDGSAVALFHPQQRLGIAVFVARFPVGSSGVTSTDALNQGLITTLFNGSGGSGNTNLQSVQPQQQRPTIGGSQWDEQGATFSDSNGNLMHIVSIAVKHGTSYFGFIFQTPDVYYSDVTQKFVQPMLDSFKFLS